MFCTELGISSSHGSESTPNTNCTDEYHPCCSSGHQPVEVAQGQHWLQISGQECGFTLSLLDKVLTGCFLEALSRNTHFSVLGRCFPGTLLEASTALISCRHSDLASCRMMDLPQRGARVGRRGFVHLSKLAANLNEGSLSARYRFNKINPDCPSSAYVDLVW